MFVCVHPYCTRKFTRYKMDNDRANELRVKVSKETVALRRWDVQGNLVISTKLKM